MRALSERQVSLRAHVHWGCGALEVKEFNGATHTHMNDTRITVTVPFQEVAWAKALDVLVGRFKLPFLDADRAVHDFFKRFFRVLNQSWFRRRAISELDNSIATALCEIYSADTIVITHERPLKIGPLEFGYGLSLALAPTLTRQSERSTGTVTPRVVLAGFGRRVELTRLRHIVGAQCVTILVAIVCYVVLAACLLYGVSVLWQFHRAPAEVIIAATSQIEIGVALLAVSVGFAGLFGRAIRNVFGLARERWPILSRA
jgi:hypothetical protein